VVNVADSTNIDMVFVPYECLLSHNFKILIII
jgi:hypothetical protein